MVVSASILSVVEALLWPVWKYFVDPTLFAFQRCVRARLNGGRRLMRGGNDFAARGLAG
jgi:hypothetical protein